MQIKGRCDKTKMQSGSIIYTPKFITGLVGRIQQNKMFVKLAAFSGLGVLLVHSARVPVSLAGLGVFGAYVVTGGWHFIWVICNTLGRDLWSLYSLLKIRFKVQQHTKNRETIGTLFKKIADSHPNKIAFRIEDRIWNYQNVEDYSNTVANHFLRAGYHPGDVVALFKESCPEYVCIWLGLSKIGIITALINFNLRGYSLLHCINDAKPKAIICGSELAKALEEIVPNLDSKTIFYYCGSVSNSISAVSLDQVLEKESTKAPPSISNFKDKLMFIYTSGTTGLPKAATITHCRYFFMAYGIKQFLQVKESDILYNTLPLYHSAGGILGIGQTLLGGTTCVIRKKFSASQFWIDCVHYGCTVSQYIGEICRYLLAQPNRPEEKQHKLRLMFGNGLRPQIWEQFQKRFSIEQIGEFYGATEGNCSLINIDNTVGAVGYTTRILPFLYPVTLVKVDEYTGEPVRDTNGICVKAKPGEPGLLVGKIVKGDPTREFDGYLNQKETSKKIIPDVFRKGDRAFATGDILSMDHFGYMYFRDRTGDTFRWKGENVSTSEVEAVISNILKLQDVVVYGVEIPGVEGRAGMAAIVDENESLNLDGLCENIATYLPVYARPLFIRLLKCLQTTGTFKIQKTDLRKENFNVNLTKDKIYYMDSSSRKYQLITPDIYQDICSGKIRF
ncbi:long-chain fatty acid transport protein 4 [Octopus vulgaris]|uniref:long-chain-fatty-acid--CoA ligase n=1 Tax=Octopus vulgaris TaxID=6645 RepID=A0AA36BR17_OCTVU|nr:long-chain fatty acid transport protein 4 [Octopus vulgaris]